MNEQQLKNYKPTDAEKSAIKTAASDPAPKRDTIPVAMLKFSDQQPLDIPGKGAASSINGTPHHKVIDADGKRILNEKCWVIDYIPSMRHHRVVYYSADGKDPAPVVRMVHESNVRTWEPLAL